MICWTDRVKNEGVYQRVKEEMNIVCARRRRKADWIGHILHRNCLLKHVIAFKTVGRREGGRRMKVREFERDNMTQQFWKSLRICRKTGYAIYNTHHLTRHN